MNDKSVTTRIGHRAHEVAQLFIGVARVDADACFHRDRDADRCAHGGDAFRDQLWFGHQTRAEAAGLHAIAGAAHVQIDFIVTVVRADARRLGQIGGHAAAQLQRDRMFRRVEVQ